MAFTRSPVRSRSGPPPLNLLNRLISATNRSQATRHDLETIRDIKSRLGLADVREFGLSWEDCEGYLSRLGYRTKVDVVQAS